MAAFTSGIPLVTERQDLMRATRRATVALLVLGLGLHSYTHAVLASAFDVRYWLWSISPYLLVALLLWRGRWPCAALGAALLPVICDMAVHYAVFHTSGSSTAAVALIMMPFWNLVVVLPVGAALGWLIDRRHRSKPADFSEQKG